jgi:hypothetical protein
MHNLDLNKSPLGKQTKWFTGFSFPQNTPEKTISGEQIA